MIDANSVKERISLRDLFQRDGHELKQVGSVYLCRCPFHEEKSASCHVHENERFFKCFGCPAGGDCFNYWQDSRGCQFPEALAKLAVIAGVVEGEVPPPVKPSMLRTPPSQELAPGLSGSQLKVWLDSVERLREDVEAQEKIATWRGFQISTVSWAAERGLMGLMPYLGAWREAFLVERPDGDGQLAVAYHIRLAPRSPGNDNPKASWRFEPKGCGAWPFVIGDLRNARAVFCLEGQWDALTLVDVMGWAEKLPVKIAIVGMRGATSWKRFMRFCHWPADATFFLFSDSDVAGLSWFAEDGFHDALLPTCSAVWGFFPKSVFSKDFNDLWKESAFTRDQLVEVFRNRLTTAPKVKRARRQFEVVTA